jgi:hypothetical protein
MTFGRKFWVAMAGLFVTTLTALTGHMDGNVVIALSTCVGGFMGANAAIDRAHAKKNMVCFEAQPGKPPVIP